MNIRWTKNLKGTEKTKRVDEIKNYRNAFLALTDILEEETSTPDYDCPSWDNKQADQNGYNRAIREIKKLITVKDS